MHDPASDDDDISASINVTPFVDVVLVLLVIFMMTTDIIRPQAIDVQLPKAAQGGATLPETLNLVVNRNGQILLDGVSSQEGEIRARLQKATEAGKKPQVVIAADRAVDYGRVIQLIDLVKAHGIDNFALQVERG